MEYRRDYDHFRLSMLECVYEHGQCVILDRERYKHIKRNLQRDYQDWLGYAEYQFEHSAIYPIEQLMINVLMMIFLVKMPPEAEQYYRESINAILEKHTIEYFINHLPEAERIKFLKDLKLLKII